jgi:hypothetical protein
LLQARVERLADLAGELFLVVAQPLLVVAVVQDDVICGIQGLVVVDRTTRLVQERHDVSSIHLSAKPAAFDDDALRLRPHEGQCSAVSVVTPAEWSAGRHSILVST